MFDIYKILGIDARENNPALSEKLQHTIMEEVRYRIPAYRCDYYLYTSVSGIEFFLCKDLGGNDLGISIHVSGNCMQTLTLDQVVSCSEAVAIFRFRNPKSGETIPARVLNPDILAAPESGDKIFGQIAAFSCNGYSVTEDGDCSLEDAGDQNVYVSGPVKTVKSILFEYEGIAADCWKMIVETPIGDITLITLKDGQDAPETGQYIRAHAVMSVDIAVAPVESDSYKALGSIYSEGGLGSEYVYGDGYIPNRKNAERVLRKAIEEYDFNRFARTCAGVLRIKSDDMEVSVENKDISVELGKWFPAGKEHVESVTLLQCADPALQGWNGLVIGNERIAILNVDTVGYVDEIRFLTPSSCVLGNDPELNALAMLEYEMCTCRADMLRGHLRSM